MSVNKNTKINIKNLLGTKAKVYAYLIDNEFTDQEEYIGTEKIILEDRKKPKSFLINLTSIVNTHQNIDQNTQITSYIIQLPKSFCNKNLGNQLIIRTLQDGLNKDQSFIIDESRIFLSLA